MAQRSTALKSRGPSGPAATERPRATTCSTVSADALRKRTTPSGEVEPLESQNAPPPSTVSTPLSAKVQVWRAPSTVARSASKASGHDSPVGITVESSSTPSPRYG